MYRPEVSANNIAKFSSTGIFDTSFYPGGTLGFNNTVRTLSKYGSQYIFVGGDFTTYRGGVANRIAKINTETGLLDTVFSPTSGANGASATVNSIYVNASNLFIGGSFTAYRGGVANRIAKVNADTGVLDIVFNPASGANGAAAAVNAVGGDGVSIYIGGSFTAYRGGVANRIAKVNADTGVLDTVFNPASGANGAANTVSAIFTSGANLYIGGSFTTYRGGVANRIAKINASTGALDTTFSPVSGVNGSDNTVLTILEVNSDLYIGGSFRNYRSAVANRVAKINKDTGVLDSLFSPSSGFNGAGGNVNFIGINLSGQIILGGSFTTYHSKKVINLIEVDNLSSTILP